MLGGGHPPVHPPVVIKGGISKNCGYHGQKSRFLSNSGGYHDPFSSGGVFCGYFRHFHNMYGLVFQKNEVANGVGVMFQLGFNFKWKRDDV